MLQTDTLNFLTNLKENNSREWFQANKERYDEAHQDMLGFATQLIKELSKADTGVDSNVEPKKSLMRIYRDIRFSKDKTPYKTHFAVGRLTKHKSVEIGYYLQVEPGNKSFIAGGYWMPQGEHIKAIRQEIDYNAADLTAIIDEPQFKKAFGEFREQEKLKTLPKGYEADNKHIELLKLKSFIAYRNLTDKEILSADAPKKIATLCEQIHPLNVFLNNAIG
ncbi:DUF2461 domain-containing protein [Mucilaginibacter terrae]|uniref:Uncharacterized protein (TIGR02453 family) n=1 Tax=Mucilaginibacter terrae TaxID=1955052 RepID=A0ABU3GXY4_9SPHI|nr:DUF2461 domain-containing protein [Mucilaginibacter terrae]MDT3404456.1 uncharacterized protein (TIGR02453 family) [Mucilaginibacter terrae]